MLIIGLDTATLTLSLALVERDDTGGDRVLDHREIPPPTPHSSLLPSELDAMFQHTGRSIDALGAIVVGLGPGSFTGLRVGLATTRAIALARQIPLVGASSLKAMAHAAIAKSAQGALLVPVLDARKGEVYGGFFRVSATGLDVVSAEFVMPPAQLAERLRTEFAESDVRVFGPGRAAYPVLHALPALTSATTEPTPEAASLIASVQVLPPYSREAILALEPHYVRPSDLEWKLSHPQA
ncbi:MAG: tRNA (adenosine(37)-N6)-threonylcarbamoyltransferase complex dimerization subunit type 1 TsaB [Myxococcales bacterium]|jgi:tRNA threonylcarbamoyladenosine biosynthesis protein TsaB|nr:tRNA (adenosine(37)-N6)-threonylcarbamoyltransferase complex dimerization subunit type 1 TsaB [Myxococcales bacterium]